MEIEKMYEQLGVSRAVYEYGETVLESLRPRFDEIDQTAEYNQGKVLTAMQRNKVNATHFAATAAPWMRRRSSGTLLAALETA